MSEHRAGPLEGIRVIDVSAVVSGPLAAMILADQGADVIKVEPPGLGDILRAPNFERGGLTAFFANTNRGKRSIVLDLQSERGREIFLDLAKTADVLIQNFRPGAVNRLGIGEADLRKIKPDLIYVSISGFGPTGPYANRRVYDPIIQGITGNVAIQKNPITDFVDLVRNIVCDKSSAYTAAQAISAALFARERGAGGQHIEVPMLDAALAFFWPDGMLANTMVGEGVSPGVALYDVYRLTQTKDGHLIYFVASKSEFHGLFRALDRPDLCEDGRFDGPGMERSDLEVLGEILEDEFPKWETAELTERLVGEHVPVAPVLSLEEVFDDAQVRHNDIVVETEHPTAGVVRQARPAARFHGTPADPKRLAPLSGEHTDEILDSLGIDASAREQLRDDGIVR